VQNQEFKQCSKCELYKPIGSFSKDKQKPDGLRKHCKDCIKQYNSENKEKIAERNKHWRENNQDWIENYKEKANYNNKKSYIKHRGKRIDNAKNWRIKNKEKVKEYGKEYHKEMYSISKHKYNKQRRDRRKNNPELVRNIERNYWNKNKEKRRLKNHKRRVVMANKHKLTEMDVLFILEIYGHICFYCNEYVGEKYTLDHITPVSKGGENSIENIVPCCKSCNSSKKDNEVGAWFLAHFGTEFSKLK
jgi:hypothetical protein